jgi:hypothetical protein
MIYFKIQADKQTKLLISKIFVRLLDVYQPQETWGAGIHHRTLTNVNTFSIYYNENCFLFNEVRINLIHDNDINVYSFVFFKFLNDFNI